MYLAPKYPYPVSASNSLPVEVEAENETKTAYEKALFDHLEEVVAVLLYIVEKDMSGDCYFANLQINLESLTYNFEKNMENGGLESLYCERTRRYHSNEW